MFLPHKAPVCLAAAWNVEEKNIEFTVAADANLNYHLNLAKDAPFTLCLSKSVVFYLYYQKSPFYGSWIKYAQSCKLCNNFYYQLVTHGPFRVCWSGTFPATGGDIIKLKIYSEF